SDSAGIPGEFCTTAAQVSELDGRDAHPRNPDRLLRMVEDHVALVAATGGSEGETKHAAFALAPAERVLRLAEKQARARDEPIKGRRHGATESSLRRSAISRPIASGENRKRNCFWDPVAE